MLQESLGFYHTVFAGVYSHIRIKRAPPVSVFWVFGRQFSNFKVDFHDEKNVFSLENHPSSAS